MDPRTSQMVAALMSRYKLEDIVDKPKVKGEKPRSRPVKKAPEGKGVKKTGKVSGGSAQRGRKQQVSALKDFTKAASKIPADKMKRMQEKTKDNNARKYKDSIHGQYMENVATPEEYRSWEHKLYGVKR